MTRWARLFPRHRHGWAPRLEYAHTAHGRLVTALLNEQVRPWLGAALLLVGGSDRQLARAMDAPFVAKDSSEVSRPRDPDVAKGIVEPDAGVRARAIVAATVGWTLTSVGLRRASRTRVTPTRGKRSRQRVRSA